jgi:rod shape-determining protein MreD
MLRTAGTFIVACILGLIFQAVLVHGLVPSAIAPDFITVLVVYIGFHHRSPAGAVGAFALGVLEDSASGQFLGPNAAGAVIAFLVTVAVVEKVYAERTPALIGLVVFASLAKCFTVLGILAVYVRVNLFGPSAVWTMLAEALLSAAVAPLVVKVLQPSRQYSTVQPVTGRESLRWSH